MRRALVLAAFACCASALAGCSTEYYAQVDGDIRGTDAETPRTVRAGIYDDVAAGRALPSAAGPHLKAIKDGHVTVGLRFGDEKKPRAVETITIDSATGRFHYVAAGETRERLTSVSIRVEAPGWEPVEQSFSLPNESKVRLHVLGVLDPLGLPAPPPRNKAETPPPEH
jgi:hypothetical protein